MTAKTISEVVQPGTSALRECLFSARIAHPMTLSLVAKSRHRAHGAPGPYRSKLRAALCGSRLARALNGADLQCAATCSCFPRMLYPIGWIDLVRSARLEPRN